MAIEMKPLTKEDITVGAELGVMGGRSSNLLKVTVVRLTKTQVVVRGPGGGEMRFKYGDDFRQIGGFYGRWAAPYLTTLANYSAAVAKEAKALELRRAWEALSRAYSRKSIEDAREAMVKLEALHGDDHV